ncbi:MAG: hypothetical protein LBT80_03115 [Lactobacillaceae bacterium]|jgi:hypothetical protein|nr:hypothetical protein [Lactobacillaceae bacterium]
MAKWKHALMVTTLVAPIVLGAGTTAVNAASSFANANYTDVAVHKYVQTTDGDTVLSADAHNYYWGDGGEAANSVFETNDDYRTANAGEYGFTAFQVPTNVITGFSAEATEKDKPVISDKASNIVIAGKNYNWNELFQAVKPTITSTSAGEVKSGWTIQVKAGINAKALAIAVQAISANADLVAATADSGIVSATAEQFTDGNGDANFDDLTNGNWIILETSAGQDVGVDGVAKPMVLSLPMQNPGTGDKWFGHATAATGAQATVLNLYPKNFAKEGDLRVIKYDSDDTSDKLKNVKFGLFQFANVATKEDFNTALADEKNSKNNYLRLVDAVTVANGDKANLPSWVKDAIDVTDYATAEEAALAAFIVVYNDTALAANQIDAEDITLVDTKSTGAAGAGAYFTHLKPGATYYVLELTYPTKQSGQTEFLKNGELREVTLKSVDASAAMDDFVATEEDGLVDYWGAHLDVLNDDSSIDKTINASGQIVAPDGTTSPIEDKVTFKDADKTQGITRGQDFQYGISADLNQPGKLKKYEIVDHTPYQVDVKDATIALALDTDGDGKFGEAGEYFPLVKATINNDYKSGLRAGDAAANLAVSLSIVNQAIFEEVFGTGVTAADVFTVTGKTSSYTLGENGGSKKGSDGSLSIAVANTDALALLQAFMNAKSVTDAHVNLTLTAVTNSAAQAEVINNAALLELANDFDKINDGDITPTFAAGWDIIKKDQDGNALVGAGFVLGHKVEADNLKTIKDSSLAGTNGANKTVVSTDNLVAIYDVLSNSEETLTHELEPATSRIGQAVSAYLWLNADRAAITTGANVYVATLDATGQPILDALNAYTQSGDVYWTTAKALATTKISDAKGHLEFSGLAAGKYALIETIAPTGYTKLEDEIKFSLAGADGAGTAEYPLYNGLKSDDKIGELTNKLDVVNYKKSIFPVTGGIGLVLMLLAGITVIAAGIFKVKRDHAK